MSEDVRVDENGVKYIDVTPTDDGYRAMLELFKASVSSHEEDLSEIEVFLASVGEMRLTNRIWDILEADLEKQKDKIQDDIAQVKKSISEIELYLGMED